jgi:pimeloyl-ACP methyl ester carboxylesterase
MQLSELHSFIDYVKENKPLIAKAPISFLLGFRTTKWLREHLEHDPSRIATLVKCPVVIFSGDKDFQLDAINDGQRLARLITNAGNCNVNFYLLKDVDHLFRVEKAESVPLHYYDRTRAMSSEFLDILVKWILSMKRTKENN